MAYIGQKEKKELAPAIKKVLKTYGMKGSIAIDNHSSLVVNVKEGVLDFSGHFTHGDGYIKSTLIISTIGILGLSKTF